MFDLDATLSAVLITVGDEANLDRSERLAIVRRLGLNNFSDKEGVLMDKSVSNDVGLHDTIVGQVSTGIGAAICRAFLQSGLRVVNLSRRPLEACSEGLVNVEVDLSDRKQTEKAALKVAAEHSVTGFVHNAGLIRPSKIEAVDLDDYYHLGQVHIGAAITLSQAFRPI